MPKTTWILATAILLATSALSAATEAPLVPVPPPHLPASEPAPAAQGTNDTAPPGNDTSPPPNGTDPPPNGTRPPPNGTRPPPNGTEPAPNATAPDLSPEEQNASGPAGTRFAAWVRLANDGPDPMSVQIRAYAPLGWTATPTARDVVLQPKSAIDLAVELEAALPGSADIRVVASSTLQDEAVIHACAWSLLHSCPPPGTGGNGTGNETEPRPGQGRNDTHEGNGTRGGDPTPPSNGTEGNATAAAPASRAPLVAPEDPPAAPRQDVEISVATSGGTVSAGTRVRVV